jgi:hypothetical protein
MFRTDSLRPHLFVEMAGRIIRKRPQQHRAVSVLLKPLSSEGEKLPADPLSLIGIQDIQGVEFAGKLGIALLLLAAACIADDLALLINRQPDDARQSFG